MRAPLASIAWYYGEFLHQCAHPTSTNLIPDSFEFDQNTDSTDMGQHLSFVLEVNYAHNLQGHCWDMVSLLTNAERPINIVVILSAQSVG